MIDLAIDDDIFARYGKILYHAQILEYALKRVLLLYSKNEPKLTENEIMLFEEGKIIIQSNPPSLGTYIKELQKIEELASIDKLVKSLYEVMGDRNFLSHEFFWERYRLGEDIAHYKVYKEFDHYERLFQKMEYRLNELIVQWAERTLSDNPYFLGSLRESGFPEEMFNKDLIWSMENSITIETQIDDVWQVFVDPHISQHLGGWYESDWTRGSSVCFKRLDGTIHAHGEIYEVMPPVRLHYSWFLHSIEGNSFQKVYSRTIFELADVNNSTELIAKEIYTRPLSTEQFSELHVNWNGYLEKIKRVSEKYARTQRYFTPFWEQWRK